MEIIVLDQKLTLREEQQSGKEILEKINEQVEKTPFFVSHLIVDGVPIYEEFERFIDQHRRDIHQIVVETRDIETFIQEILIAEMQYLEGAIPEIRELVEELRTQPDENTWMKLGDFFDALQWIFESFEGIDSLQNLNAFIRDYPVWNHYSQQIFILNSRVPDMEKVFGRQDFVELARILEWDVAPVLQLLLEYTQQLVDLDQLIE